MPRQPDRIVNQGVTGICLPTGEIVDASQLKSFHFNPAVGALRFSFSVQRTNAINVDKLTSSVTGVEKNDGRCVVIAHRFFQYQDTIYVADADMKVIQARES